MIRNALTERKIAPTPGGRLCFRATRPGRKTNRRGVIEEEEGWHAEERETHHHNPGDLDTEDLKPGATRGALKELTHSPLGPSLHSIPAMKIPAINSSILGLCVALSAPLLAAPGEPIPLWPDGAPGEAGLKLPPEKSEDKNNDGILRVSHVSEPTISFYPAPGKSNTGATVIVCPGGGYSILAISHEGTQVCEWLNSIGVNAVLLKYRVPRRENLAKHHAPLQDSQRAVALVRSRAAEWRLDPDRIGILGFSAGGHLATMTLTSGETPASFEHDLQESCRPDFGILVYPAYLQDDQEPGELASEIEVGEETPPIFMVIAHGDRRFTQGNALLYLALARVNASAELHVFAKGGHGFGMKKIDEEVARWPELAANWMKALDLLGKQTPPKQAGDPSGEGFTHPPVGVLKSGRHEVVLHVGPGGPLYSIRNEAGKLLALEIDRPQLATRFPEIHEEISGLLAGNEAEAIALPKGSIQERLPARPR